MHPVHLWNRAFADASFVLLCLIVAVGPLARIVPKLQSLMAWRREFGVWCAVAALIHVAIFAKAFDYNPVGFFAKLGERGWALQKTPAAVANWVGLPALALIAALALTSNDFSRKKLGRGWKQLQQQTYTVFILSALHTAIFAALLHNKGSGVFVPVMWGGIVLALAARMAGFAQTVSQGPPAEEDKSGPTGS